MSRTYYVGNEPYRNLNTAIAVAVAKREAVLAQLRHKKMVTLPATHEQHMRKKKAYLKWLLSRRNKGVTHSQFLLTGISVMQEYVRSCTEYGKLQESYRMLMLTRSSLENDIKELKASQGEGK